MNHAFATLLLAAATIAAPAPMQAAETLRNPVGTAAPVSSTLRNPVTAGAAPQPQKRVDRSEPAVGGGGGDTRPPKGADAFSPPPSKTFAPSGPIGSPGIPGGGSSGGGGPGGGSPGLFNAAGANGGTTPAGEGALKPNGGPAASGSKAAPMQANGVRKVE